MGIGEESFFARRPHLCAARAFYLALSEYVVVSSPQRGENAAFFSSFPLGGIHSQGILLVVPLGLQGKKHQPFSMVQPFILKWP
ncbi:hypothetical protein [uncultured Bilophila sp.]|uniref:hypothetical protein n=1 Tax=uncultured Bilophila sp. TaxID=529385 RepID=UPI00266EB57A|nr:hypothetical protein [uncultured Bilophila sp.]